MVALLQLPFLAFKHVFRQLDFLELFQLSLLSKRTKNCIRASIRKSTFHIAFVFGGLLEIWPEEQFVQYPVSPKFNGIHGFSSTADQYNFRKDKEHKIGGYTMGVYKGDTDIYLRWRQEAGTSHQVAFEVFKHVIELLNGPMVSVEFDDCMKEEDMLEVMAFIKQHKLSIHLMTNDMVEVTGETFAYFMDECKNATILKIKPAAPNGFKYSPPTPQAFRMKRVTIENDSWVNLEEFMECETIYLNWNHGMPESAQKVNRFLREWANSNSRLSFVSWACNYDRYFEAIVEGLGNEKSIEIY